MAAPSSDGEPVVLAGAPAPEVPLAGAPAPSDIAPEPTAAAAAPAEPPSSPTAQSLSPSDPLEPVNRRLYAVDSALGRAIKKRPQIAAIDNPRSRGVLKAARNALDNLDEPSTAANDLLQQKLAAAGHTAVRFVINSTVGIVGLFDVASRIGLEKRSNNFDRTLAKYGAPAGPYLYIPVAGPATLRGVLAMAAEGYLYPPHWVHLATGVGTALRGAGYAKMAARTVQRADDADGRKGVDAYARTRSAYLAAATQPEHDTRPAGGARTTEVASLSRGD